MPKTSIRAKSSISKIPNQPFPQYIAESLEKVISNLPDTFYNTFDFTQRGNNLTHPITIALLARICHCNPKIKHVGVDVRLNNAKGTRFSPDIVAYEDNNMKMPVLFIDYESPNSSDRRISKKDIEPYVAWMNQRSEAEPMVPYIVITTLPDEKAKWKLLYVKQNNSEEAEMDTKINENPLKFWKQRYKKDFRHRVTEYPISLLNISGKSVKQVIF